MSESATGKQDARVLVSVLSYNSLEHTIETIRSLQKQTWQSFDLQLLDNASESGFVERIASIFPDLKIMALKENLGYTGGNNLALRQALEQGYDYVVITNHDIEVNERAIEYLVETAQKYPDAGIIGGATRCYFSGETQVPERGRFSFWFCRARRLSTAQSGEGAVTEVGFVMGALILFTRRTLECGIKWDDKLFMYYDEVDMSIDLARQGLKAYLDRRVIVMHKNREKWLNNRSGYLQQRNRLYLVRKHGRWYHKIFYLLYSSLIEIPAKSAIRSLQGKKDYAWACILGQVDGLFRNMGRGRIDYLSPFLRR